MDARSDPVGAQAQAQTYNIDTNIGAILKI